MSLRSVLGLYFALALRSIHFVLGPNRISVMRKVSLLLHLLSLYHAADHDSDLSP